MSFDLNLYLGVWYELAHYPTWFLQNDNYNTMAEYSLNSDGSLRVHNSTFSNGQQIDVEGNATILPGSGRLSVRFSPFETIDQEKANYVIDKIFTNAYGQYVFAIVTDDDRQSLYVLSRYKHPSLLAYNQLVAYLNKNYDTKSMIPTPHYD